MLLKISRTRSIGETMEIERAAFARDHMDCAVLALQDAVDDKRGRLPESKNPTVDDYSQRPDNINRIKNRAEGLERLDTCLLIHSDARVSPPEARCDS